MVLREVLIVTGVGLAISVPVVLATTKLVKAMLFAMKPNDPVTLTAATGVLVLASVFAGYAPARRASRIDPMVALRHE